MACSRAPEPRTRIFTRPAYRAAGLAACATAVGRRVGRIGTAYRGAMPRRITHRRRPRGARRRAGGGRRHPRPARTDLATAVRYLLQLLAEKAPGHTRRGARAAVRRGAGDRGSAAHPRARRRTSSRPTPRPGSRSRPARSSGRMPPPPAASWRRASAPTLGPAAPAPLTRTTAPPRPAVRQWRHGRTAHTPETAMPRHPLSRASPRRGPASSGHRACAARRQVLGVPGRSAPRSALLVGDDPDLRVQRHRAARARTPGLVYSQGQVFGFLAAHLHPGRPRPRRHHRADPRPRARHGARATSSSTTVTVRDSSD